MSVLDVLLAGRARIERGWIKGNYAISKEGRPVKSYSPDAVCFCALGAVGEDEMCEHTQTDNTKVDAINLLVDATRKYFGYNKVHYSLDEFNDDPDTTQADVLTLFDLAIEQLTSDHCC